MSKAAEDGEYGQRAVVNTSGGLNILSGATGETEVKISSHPECVGLKISTELGEMRARLLPEDVERLCEALLEAKGDTNPAEVACCREQINEFQSGGDRDE